MCDYIPGMYIPGMYILSFDEVRKFCLGIFLPFIVLWTILYCTMNCIALYGARGRSIATAIKYIFSLCFFSKSLFQPHIKSLGHLTSVSHS